MRICGRVPFGDAILVLLFITRGTDTLCNRDSPSFALGVRVNIDSWINQDHSMSRRGLLRTLALGLAVTASIPASSAFAVLKMPLKESPPRVMPLGRWAMLSQKNEVRPGNSIDIELSFRSATLVNEGVLRWWRKSSVLPICANASCKPFESNVGPLVSGAQVPVTIALAIPSNAPAGYYRINCEMSDPNATRRRSVYSFLVRVVIPRQN